MKKYIPGEFENKWAKKWKEVGLFSPDLDKAKKPFYSLMMFPYPSAEGMHVGNMYAFTGSDVYSRFKRLQGFDVFEPIGLDGFGIHGENYAMKINEHPMEVSKRTEKHFYEQFLMVGNAFDWQRIVDTYKPNYYKWTQWAFLQLYKKGLAYRKKAEVNWCPLCMTVLADEQVVSGECERCASMVGKKELEQWFFKITDYAEKLLSNIDSLDWSEIIKVAQRNWIGKSEGASIKFEIVIARSEETRQSNKKEIASPAKLDRNDSDYLEVFTTRPDTVFGATFLVVSPEHPFVNVILNSFQDLGIPKQVRDDIEEYVEKSKKKSELERKSSYAKASKDKGKTGLPDEVLTKSGVFTGSYAKNPLTGEDIPIWVADYVLMGYGTGAIMAVPAHDDRDLEFAKKYNLEIKPVIARIRQMPETRQSNKEEIASPAELDRNDNVEVYEGDGVLINSGEFNGLSSDRAKESITKYLEEHQLGKKQVQYHLRDWLISRQRYWGPPIPIIYCDKCGLVPVPEKDLPVELPYIKDFKPTGTGVGPLASDSDFINTICPQCGGKAKRETDVSDNFFDSSLYFFRYLTTDFADRFFDDSRTKKWLPVDMYIGGAEHAVLHLLYSRFITMAFKDMGFIDFEEPFKQFRAHGLIIKDGAKMSKSKGNIIVPDKYIKEWGADVFRAYLMFMGPFTGGGDFQDDGLNGVYRFLNRIWNLVLNFKEAEASLEENRMLHKTIQKAGLDYENLHYNTVISGLMELLNFLSKQTTVSKETIKAILIMLSPVAPFMTEELWSVIAIRQLPEKQSRSEIATSPASPDPRDDNNRQSWSIHQQPWPKYDPKYLEEEEIIIVVSVDGKVRDNLVIQKDMVDNRKDIENLVMASSKVQKFVAGKEIVKNIYIPGKIFNIVTESK
ncbi:MAG: leucine--tRNA ligase [Candidatus Daviesbacteria bacterium]|nr:leucine--tRNA ligase [Candidatus Daviesbacteria bacterium]